VLDHAAIEIAVGSKLGIDATKSFRTKGRHSSRWMKLSRRGLKRCPIVEQHLRLVHVLASLSNKPLPALILFLLAQFLPVCRKARPSVKP
jgi:hypothetical protein